MHLINWRRWNSCWSPYNRTATGKLGIIIFHRVRYCKEPRLTSSFETSSSRNQPTSNYWLYFTDIPDVVDVLGKSFWQKYIVLQLRILDVLELLWGTGSDWKSLDSSNIETFSWLFLFLPIVEWPLRNTLETLLLLFHSSTLSSFFTAPSIHRGTVRSCRSNLVMAFDTS